MVEDEGGKVPRAGDESARRYPEEEERPVKRDEAQKEEL